MNTLLEAKNLRAYYQVREGWIKAVENVGLKIKEDEIVGLAGESGCGKSTLVNVLMMNIRPPLKLISGTITLGDVKISGMTPRNSHRQGRRA